jgi:hypothetical protein
MPFKIFGQVFAERSLTKGVPDSLNNLSIKAPSTVRMTGDLDGLQGWRLVGVSARYEKVEKPESGDAEVA